MPFVKKGNRRGFNFRRNDQLSENDNSEKDSDQITTPEQSEFLTLREDDTANELLPEYTEESESSSVDPVLLMTEIMHIGSENQLDMIPLEMKVEDDNQMIEYERTEPNNATSTVFESDFEEKFIPGYDQQYQIGSLKASTTVWDQASSEDYCRLCFTSIDQHNKEHIFYNRHNVRYSQQIKDCIGLTVQENDGYSSYLCSDCKRQLIEFYNFRLKCQFSDYKMKEMIHIPILKNVHSNRDPKAVNNAIKMASIVTTSDAKTESINDIASNTCQMTKAATVENQILTDSKAADATDMPFNLSTLDPEETQDCNIKPHVSFPRTNSMRKNQPRNYVCHICGMIVSTLRTHMIIHQPRNKCIFKCTTCGKGFRRNDDLKRHSLYHLTVKPFPCKLCNLSFVTKYKLDIHHVVHTGKREHQCHLCEKRFQTRYNLRTHIRSHTRERPYKCPRCELTFIHRATLNPHVKKCTGD